MAELPIAERQINLNLRVPAFSLVECAPRKLVGVALAGRPICQQLRPTIPRMAPLNRMKRIEVSRQGLNGRDDPPGNCHAGNFVSEGGAFGDQYLGAVKGKFPCQRTFKNTGSPGAAIGDLAVSGWYSLIT